MATAVASLAPRARDVLVRRALALLLDLIVLSLLVAVVNAVYGVTQITSEAPPAVDSGFVGYMQTLVWLWLLSLAYFTIPEAMFGATFGKWRMGLRVVLLTTGTAADLGPSRTR